MAINFEELKREDCRTVARRLGLELNRQDKVRCFLHAGDKNPSLQVYADGWKCFGCGEHGDAVDLVARYRGISKGAAAQWIVDTMGIPQPIAAPTPKKSSSSDYGKFEREHIYPGGQLKHVVYRKANGGKSAPWKHLENGVWLDKRPENLFPVPPLYYRRDNLPPSVFLVEGEKDVDRLEKNQKAAISLPDGKDSKWYSEYQPFFSGRNVYIIQDNDEPGKQYAQRMAATLQGIAKSVYVLDLTKVWLELPTKGDISDLLDYMGDDAGILALLQLAQDAPEWEPSQAPGTVEQGRKVKAASEFGEDNTKFLWYPYIPIGDYTVMMADGGTGKTILCCGIAASISAGKPLPGDVFAGEKENVLIISGEDSGEVLKSRLKKSGADLNKVFILDRIDSEGMSISERYDEFEATFLQCKPALTVLDPWHCFLGTNVDISRINSLRPVLQKLSNLCKKCDCAMILISHVNKREQGANANNAAMGSADLINAARSAFRVIFDETDEDCRIMVHTKSNYASYGQSVKYRIVDGGVEWAGFSDITRQTLELAARRKSTPGEVIQNTSERDVVNNSLILALESAANQFVPTRYSYDEFKKLHGDLIFGGLQPKRALDGVKDRLADDGFFLKTCPVKKSGKMANGFMIQRIDTNMPEQVGL